MKIYYALKPTSLNQGFGKEHTAQALLATYQSLGLSGHDGMDWSTVCKDDHIKTGGQCLPVYCDIDGYATITFIQKDITYGSGIIALDQDGDHKHLWWHFDIINPDLKVGDRIEGGELLGISGNTGISTGAHLHRGLYSFSEPYANGYHGAIDPTPFYSPIFILDYIQTLQNKISILQKLIALYTALKNLLKK